MSKTKQPPPYTVVDTREGYELRRYPKEGLVLWTTGRYAYECGYVMDAENLDTAIDAHEEEVRVLMDQARREFGVT